MVTFRPMRFYRRPFGQDLRARGLMGRKNNSNITGDGGDLTKMESSNPS